MTRPFTRRRFLTIAAATLAAGAGRAESAATEWHGVALGAPASLTIRGDRHAAETAITSVQAELQRLERIFSLYNSDSALVRLNRNGWLAAPPPELLEVLSLSGQVHRQTGGAFDPTIQPLWQAYAEAAGSPGPDRIEAAWAQVGWQHLRFDADEIAFARPGMALTLNGIAQGYITDRIAALLKARGMTDVLVDMGEIAALGTRADGTAWRAGIAAPDGRILHRVTLSDRCLATSAPSGTVLDPAGEVGHIFDPRRRAPAEAQRVASVSATSAALADGLSTAFCLMTPAEIDAAVAELPGARVETLI